MHTDEEAELDSRLADLHRYPFQLDSGQWKRLRELARTGDRGGQLDLLRQLVPGHVPGSGSRRSSVPSAELSDRLARLEQRLSAAERRIGELERGHTSGERSAAAPSGSPAGTA
jgi:hypothetical protein